MFEMTSESPLNIDLVEYYNSFQKLNFLLEIARRFVIRTRSPRGIGFLK